MGNESRSDKMYRQIGEFLEDENAEVRHFVLYKSEVEKLEKHLYEQDIAANITEKKDLTKGKVRITLQKV